MPKSRDFHDSNWKSQVDKALGKVRESSGIDTAPLEEYAASASEFDWSMTLEQQQGLCGSELGKSGWFMQMTTLSIINLVRETQFILNED